MPHQIFEQAELPWFQLDRLAGPLHGAADQVHLQIADVKTRLLLFRAFAAKKRLDTSEQFRKRIGFRKVVVGACL